MKIWILTFEVPNLGLSVEGVYDEPSRPYELAAEHNSTPSDNNTWVGEDGETYIAKDQWSVQEHDVIHCAQLATNPPPPPGSTYDPLTGQDRPIAGHPRAHSKSEYKRRAALDDPNAAPPDTHQSPDKP